MSNAFIRNRNKVLFEALMNSKFHKDKKNFVLKEIDLETRKDIALEKGMKDLDLGEKEKEKLKYLQKIFGHTVLDIIGFLDPEPATDLINALWYYSDEEYFDSFMSVVAGFIPYIGDFVGKGIKYSWKAAKTTSYAIPLFKEGLAVISHAIAKNNELIQKILLRMHISGAEPRLIKFVEWISDRLKNFKTFEEAVQKLDHTQEQEAKFLIELTEEFFSPKTLQRLAAFAGRQGPKHWLDIIEGFKTKPKWVIILEALFLAHGISSRIKYEFEKETTNIIYQLSLIDYEYSKKANEVAKVIKNDEEQFDLRYAMLADAIKISYIIESCGKDYDMIGYVLSKLKLSSMPNSKIDDYLKSAVDNNIINGQQASIIINKIKEYSKEEKTPTIDAFKKAVSEGSPQLVANQYSSFAESVKKFLENLQENQTKARLKKQQIEQKYLPSIEKAVKMQMKALEYIK